MVMKSSSALLMVSMGGGGLEMRWDEGGSFDLDFGFDFDLGKECHEGVGGRGWIVPIPWNCFSMPDFVDWCCRSYLC